LGKKDAGLLSKKGRITVEPKEKIKTKKSWGGFWNVLRVL